MPTVHANDNQTNKSTVNNTNNTPSTSSTTISATTLTNNLILSQSASTATLTTTATTTTTKNHINNNHNHHHNLHLSSSNDDHQLDLNGNNDNNERILLDELLESLNYETILMNETLAKAKLSALNNNPIYDVAKDHEMIADLTDFRRYRCSDSLSNSSSNNSPPSNAVQRRLISESENSSSISPSLSERSNVMWSDQVGAIKQIMSRCTTHKSFSYKFYFFSTNKLLIFLIFFTKFNCVVHGKC